MSRTQVQLWYYQFKESRANINDDARPGSPSISITDENIEAVKKIIVDNHWITITEVPDDVGISFQAIFPNVLGMKREAAKIVPKLLNFEQKQRRMDIAQRRSRFAHNWWQIMGIWPWDWNQCLIIPMEASRRSKTEKSTSSTVKCEDLAHCFLRLQWRGASWILATWSYGQ